MKRLAIPLVILTIFGAFGFWWLSPTQVLKRRTQSVLRTLTLAPGGGKAARQMGVYALNSLLASQVELETPTIPDANGTFDRQELESIFSWLCEQAKQSRFDLEKLRSVRIDGDQADVEFTLKGLVELPVYRPVDGNFLVTFHWQREDNLWRLARAKWVETSAQ